MGHLKDELNLKDRQTVTLTRAEIQFLEETAALYQRRLDQMQQEFAVSYLKQVAIDRFGYALNDTLEFNLDMKMYANNLEIIKRKD
jgi:hypothetical protein